MSLTLALLLAAAQPASGDFNREEESDLLRFSYSWPAAAERESPLRIMLQHRMGEVYAGATTDAREDQRARREGGFEFYRHESSTGWELVGNPVGLISLTGSTFTFTGGAHGNYSFDAILWDDSDHRPIDVRDFLRRDVIDALGPVFCAELDRQRAERRGEPVVPDPEDPFARCPPIGEQVLALANRDNNPQFDTLLVMLPPYVAGPYVEGDYVIEVRLDESALIHVPTGFQTAFFPWGERIRPIPDE